MATVTQQRAVPVPEFLALGFFSIDRFDSSLGTLQSVTVSVTASSTLDVSLENYDAAPVAATVSLPVTVDVSYLTYLSVSSKAEIVGSAALAAFDGVADYAGPSGTVLAGLSASQTATKTFTGAEANYFNLASFPSMKQMQLFAYSSYVMSVTAGAGLRLLSDMGAVTADVVVTYDYTPPAPPPSGAAAGASIIFTGAFDTIATVFPTPFGLATPPPVQQRVTGPKQVLTVAAAPAGSTSTIAVDRFDPALGTLLAVNMRMVVTEAHSVAAENLGKYESPSGGVIPVVTMGVAAGGVTLASVQAPGPFSYLPTAPADGVTDFAGGSGTSANLSAKTVGMAKVTDATVLAALSGSGTADLSVTTSGQVSVTGGADLLLDVKGTASAVVEVSYTYEPMPEVAPIAVQNASQGTTDKPAPAAYAGPVTGVANEFALITPDNLSVSAKTDSWYIRTGSGTDAIKVTNGRNVVDGGTGSNFLAAGAGEDTFFVDALVPTSALWNTILDMGSGDGVTIWGLIQNSFVLSWMDDWGAPGATGLTLLAKAAGVPLVATTFAGYTKADLDAGRLVTGFDVAGGLPYMQVSAV